MAKQKCYKLQDFKKFTKGDLLVTTSGRTYTGWPEVITACIYDHDINTETAIEVHYSNIKKLFPSLNITYEMVVKSITEDGPMFMTDRGEVCSYHNHERADIFDKRYFDGEDSEHLYFEKDKFIREHNVMPFDDGIYRIYPEMNIIQGLYFYSKENVYLCIEV